MAQNPEKDPSSSTDEDLAHVLSHPFQVDTLAKAEEAAFLSTATRAVERPGNLQEQQDLKQFLRPVEILLRPHISTAN
ncbi:MAG: hypothetical protein KDK33_13640, partial [Leptospiraceae bacterium]|nr:hypothetical protein [Leptospiraceae bacterium]